MATKKYWKGLEELNNSPEFVQKANNEFAEQLPVEKFLDDKNLESEGTNRRDFLKFLGFSITAASLAACETPVNKAIPYVVKPEEITPGVANWYASTYYDGRDYAAILVKTREARPIKIMGNSLSKVSSATNARIQASVLSLYDSSRLKGPWANGKDASWNQVDKEIGDKLTAINAKGGQIRILTSTIISPSTKGAIAEFTAKYPTTKVVTYDAISYSAMNKANEMTFGTAAIPTYHFDKAWVVVSVGADFLGNWVQEASADFSKTRKVSKENPHMSKHYQFESNMSLSGANADERTPVKVSEQGKVAVALYNAVAKMTGGSSIASSSLPYDEAINKAAKDLVANKGKSIVVAGPNDVNVQLVVNGINQMLGNYGTTIDIENPSMMNMGDDKAFADLVTDMTAGKVDALITYNTNPVYTAPAALKFADAYNKVGLRISFAERADETGSMAHYVCPDHHYLESWNDFNPVKAHYSISQPTISPLYNTRQAQETLLKWSGISGDYHAYMQKTWQDRVFPMQGKYMGFVEFWNHSLQDGAIEVGMGTDMPEGSMMNDSTKMMAAAPKNAKKEEKSKEEPKAPVAPVNLNDAAQKINAVKTGTLELALYEKMGMGNGNQANNPWLHELPDPITKITWDNYVTMSPADMEEKKYELMKRQDRTATVVNVTVNGVTIKLPVVPQPGQARGTVGIAVGYGRDKAGSLSERTKTVIGQNAYPFSQYMNDSIQYTAMEVTVADANETTDIAGTQIHHTLMGREIVKETVLSEYQKNPKAGNEDDMLITNHGTMKAGDLDLWDSFDRPGHKWGMTIDLNSCIGCGACVVSCTAENNVAVVGKDQVMRTREMHWLRIDRYYSTNWPNEGKEAKKEAKEKGVGAIDMYLDMENPEALNPKVVFQPMMCQHCNHAPCENVCPVLATNHSSDGLNTMAYNRCVGTRYCANNCPFKVRRFNWFNYNANADFTFNPSQDDLGRMVLNPDVVVRSRGVMEKCSMCVQRIQAGKLEAKKAERKLVDTDVNTACAEACPTNAITFGDLNSEDSAIAKLRVQEKDGRNFFVLEEIGVKPSVSYLTKVRNCEEVHHMSEATEEKAEKAGA